MVRLSDAQVEVLVVAVLAVGGWPAPDVRSALPALRPLGVLSPEQVSTMDLGVLTVALAKNGYNRGLLTSMYAERLQSVMKAVHSGSLDGLPELVRKGNQTAFESQLKELHGIGPKVANNAWSMMLELC